MRLFFIWALIAGVSCSSSESAQAEPSLAPATPAAPAPDLAVPPAPQVAEQAPKHLSTEEILALLKSTFAVGIMSETASLDKNLALCGTLAKSEQPAITAALENFDSSLDGRLRMALGEARECLTCTPTSIDACWRLPAYIRAFGGTAPRLTLGDATSISGPQRAKVRSELIRRYDKFMKYALECDEISVPADQLADLDRLHDAVEAFEPPDDNLRELAYELSACLECGKHYLAFCDRAHFAVARAKKKP